MLNAQHVDHIGMQRAKMSVWYSSMKTLLFVARGLKEPKGFRYANVVGEEAVNICLSSRCENGTRGKTTVLYTDRLISQHMAVVV